MPAALKTGFIGWRGMVGSVLLKRMMDEGDFKGLDAHFFSTSNAGGLGPDVGYGASPLLDARDVKTLHRCDVLISCQGGAYTTETFPALRKNGWKGIWIDAASTLRMAEDATLVLDPVNGEAIHQALDQGVNTFVGTNCTVGLMLMGTIGLLRTGLVEWVSTMTYQSASGAGAQNMRELVAQMHSIGEAAAPLLSDPASAALELDQKVSQTLHASTFPTARFGAPLAASAIPWVDTLVEDGQTREEWKAMAEANKLMGIEDAPIPIDGLCVRIGAMRCHSQALTIKLKQAIPLDEINAMISEAHPWVTVVDNTQEATLRQLTPAAVSGSLMVPVGRLRKMKMGPKFLTAFTVGDQLLWGAAEPLRRILTIIRNK